MRQAVLGSQRRGQVEDVRAPTVGQTTIPASIESITPVLMASFIPKSSQLTMRTRASAGQPNSSLDRTEGIAGSGARLSMLEV